MYIYRHIYSRHGGQVSGISWIYKDPDHLPYARCGDISLMYLSCSNCERNIGQFLGWLEYPAQISLCLQKRMLYTSRHPMQNRQKHKANPSSFGFQRKSCTVKTQRSGTVPYCSHAFWVAAFLWSKWSTPFNGWFNPHWPVPKTHILPRILPSVAVGDLGTSRPLVKGDWGYI